MSLKVYEGKLIAEEKSFAIVVSRFNDFISNHLLTAAKDCLIRHGVSESQIEIAGLALWRFLLWHCVLRKVKNMMP